MKKYVKPVLIFEQFELSKNIADCAWELNQNDQNTCVAVPDPNILKGETVTLFAQSHCLYITDDETSSTIEYCYHNGGNTIFKVFQS